MMDPRTIQRNPKNWRRHGRAQREAFREFKERVGWIDALILNERTGYLIDGELRLDEAIDANEDLVPVLVVDLDPEQEAEALFFKDLIGGMADVDVQAQLALAKELKAEERALKTLVEEVVGPQLVEVEEPEPVQTGDGDYRKIGLVPGEKYDYIMLLFKHEVDWNAALEHFQIERVRDPYKPSKVGIGRVIDGGAYLRRIAGEDADLYAPQDSDTEPEPVADDQAASAD